MVTRPGDVRTGPTDVAVAGAASARVGCCGEARSRSAPASTLAAKAVVAAAAAYFVVGSSAASVVGSASRDGSTRPGSERKQKCIVDAFTPRSRAHAVNAMAFVVAALAHATTPGVPNCTVQWHTQALDHFNFAENRTFKQRVLRHDGLCRPGGPILF